MSCPDPLYDYDDYEDFHGEALDYEDYNDDVEEEVDVWDDSYDDEDDERMENADLDFDQSDYI